MLKDNDIEYRESQIKIRIAEIRSVAQALEELTPELHFEIFGGFAPNAKIDMKELILAGHSYGAATMIATASQMAEMEEKNPKALLLMDPWCQAISK